jgi:O-acetyl-ADP-ribose deacetylase (regulator of RNase III)
MCDGNIFYKNSLQIAPDNDCKTIAFPSISTVAYGFPEKVIFVFFVNNTAVSSDKPPHR